MAAAAELKEAVVVVAEAVVVPEGVTAEMEGTVGRTVRKAGMPGSSAVPGAAVAAAGVEEGRVEMVAGEGCVDIMVKRERTATLISLSDMV